MVASNGRAAKASQRDSRTTQAWWPVVRRGLTSRRSRWPLDSIDVLDGVACAGDRIEIIGRHRMALQE
jgi:hypothetical protein